LLWFCCSTVSDDYDKDVNRVVKNTPSKATTRRTSDGDSYKAREERSPSPVRSITSQDSSIFTYNPKSCKSFDSKTFGSFLTGNTGIDTGVEMDVEAWQQRSTVQKDTSIFGHDISAIENKKDLSLIEEGSEGDDNTPDKRRESQNNKPNAKRALTRNSLADFERAERQLTLTRKRSSSSSSSSRKSSSSSQRKKSSIPIDLEGDAADVINDLKDLSSQIDRYRRGSN
jgi:hypothetical protein